MNHDKNSDPLEVFFQQHLANFAEDPPEEALGNIRARLAPKPAFSWRKLAWPGLIVLLLGVVAGGSFWAKKQSQRIEHLEQQLAASQTDDSTSKNVKEALLVTKNESSKESSSPITEVQNEPLKNGQTENIRKHVFKQNINIQHPIAEGKKNQASVLDNAFQNKNSQQLSENLMAKTEAELATSKLGLPEYLVSLQIQRLQKKKKQLSATRLAKSTTFRRLATETYAGWLPINSANGLDAGLRWQVGSTIRLIDRKRWSFSFGIEYGEYLPKLTTRSAFQWNEQNTFTDAKGRKLATATNLIETGFGSGISKTKLEYLPQGDALDLLQEDDLSLQQTVRNRMQMLTVPLMLRLNFGNGRLRWHLKTGMGMTTIVHYTSSIETKVESLQRAGRYRTVFNELQQLNDGPVRAFFEAYTGCGISWQMNRRFSLLAEPTAVFTLSNMSQRTSENIRPKAFGLQIGLKRQF